MSGAPATVKATTTELVPLPNPGRFSMSVPISLWRNAAPVLPRPLKLVLDAWGSDKRVHGGRYAKAIRYNYDEASILYNRAEGQHDRPESGHDARRAGENIALAYGFAFRAWQLVGRATGVKSREPSA